MKRFVFKGKGKLWPTVTWQDTQLVVYFLSGLDDRVEIRETNGIDFNEFFFHLDGGGSIYVTVKPTLEGTDCTRVLDSSSDPKAREEDVSTWMTN